MAACKFCDEEITWTQSNGRWVPLNFGDMKPHRCQTGTSNDPYRVLYLRPDAPPEVVKAAYRVLALKYHPDTGGNNETMKRINLAYQQIVGQD